MCGIERWSGLSALGAVAENSWGVAPGWDMAGPLALEIWRTDPPAPTARLHPSLGQRPRKRVALVDALATQLAASRATAANLISALVAGLTAHEYV